MESLTETIDLDIEESNDLAFKIKLEGAASSPVKVRLVCEANDYAYMFNGYGTDEADVVQFSLPRMTSKIQEGVYQARVEVLVDNRYFSPLSFQINFKRSVSVVAESMRVVSRQKSQDLKVTAAHMLPPNNSRPALEKPQFEKRQNVISSMLSEKSSSEKKSLRETYDKKIKKSQDGEVDNFIKSLRDKFKK